jgi:hypothetical protein
MQTDDGDQVGLICYCDFIKAPIPLKQGLPREDFMCHIQANHLRNLSQLPMVAEGGFKVSMVCRFVSSFVIRGIWYYVSLR